MHGRAIYAPPCIALSIYLAYVHVLRSFAVLGRAVDSLYVMACYPPCRLPGDYGWDPLALADPNVQGDDPVMNLDWLSYAGMGGLWCILRYKAIVVKFLWFRSCGYKGASGGDWRGRELRNKGREVPSRVRLREGLIGVMITLGQPTI